MKKYLSLLLAFALALSLLTACGQPASAPPANSSAASSTEELTAWVDDLGRTVELPAEGRNTMSIAVTGPMAQMIVFALAPDQMVGIATQWDSSAEAYLSPSAYQLPVLGQLYGGKGDLNLEELLNSDAQMVIDVGEPKDSAAEDLDQLSEQTGIPFVHITATLSSMDDTYTRLGDLLQRPDEAQDLSDYCNTTWQQLTALSESVDKASVLYCIGQEGLNVIAKDSYHSEAIDLMTNNLAVVENPSMRGSGNEVDMEQLLAWNPDVILFGPGDVYETVLEDPTWQDLTAMQTGHTAESPFGPYCWMGNPPSVQVLLGMLWMGKILYPEQADYDLYEEVHAYYERFYHCDLTQSQYDDLTKTAFFPAAR